MDFESFLKHGLYIKNWSPKTPVIYRRAWASLQKCLRESGDEPVEGSITKARLEAWVGWMRERGLPPSCVSIYVRAINSYLSWLHEESGAPRLRLKSPRPAAKPLRELSDGEIRSLLSFRPSTRFERRTLTLVQTLLDTGMRIDEALGLRVDRTDLEGLHLTVHGKGNKARVVPLSLELRKALFRHLSRKDLGAGTGGLVFCTSDGMRLSYRNTYRDIKSLCAKAGVEGRHVHPHAFRHGFAVTYIRRGGDIYRLSRILGHSTISTTQIYLRSMGIEQVAENHSSLSPLARG